MEGGCAELPPLPVPPPIRPATVVWPSSQPSSSSVTADIVEEALRESTPAIRRHNTPEAELTLNEYGVPVCGHHFLDDDDIQGLSPRVHCAYCYPHDTYPIRCGSYPYAHSRVLSAIKPDCPTRLDELHYKPLPCEVPTSLPEDPSPEN